MSFNVHANPMEGPNALDLMLKTFISSQEFRDLADKNWSAISRTIPGTTPRQVYLQVLFNFLNSIFKLDNKHHISRLSN